MIRITCQCGGDAEVPESFVGETLPCPKCDKPLRLLAAGGAVLGNGDLQSRLVIQSGPQQVGEQIILGGRGALEVGKQEGKHLVLPGTLVSRSHARLARTATGGWLIQDSNSRNGLFVNGKRISGKDLRDGDVIQIGEYTIRFASSDPATAPVAGTPPPPPPQAAPRSAGSAARTAAPPAPPPALGLPAQRDEPADELADQLAELTELDEIDPVRSEEHAPP